VEGDIDNFNAVDVVELAYGFEISWTSSSTERSRVTLLKAMILFTYQSVCSHLTKQKIKTLSLP